MDGIPFSDEKHRSGLFDGYVMRAFGEGWTRGMQGAGFDAFGQLVQELGYTPRAAAILCGSVRRELVEEWYVAERMARTAERDAEKAAAREAREARRAARTAAAISIEPPRKIPIPQELRWAVFERDDFTCQRCGSRGFLTADHIHPEALGGEATMENLQTLCRSCNSAKGARLPGQLIS